MFVLFVSGLMFACLFQAEIEALMFYTLSALLIFRDTNEAYLQGLLRKPPVPYQSESFSLTAPEINIFFKP